MSWGGCLFTPITKRMNDTFTMEMIFDFMCEVSLCVEFNTWKNSDFSPLPPNPPGPKTLPLSHKCMYTKFTEQKMEGTKTTTRSRRGTSSRRPQKTFSSAVRSRNDRGAGVAPPSSHSAAPAAPPRTVRTVRIRPFSVDVLAGAVASHAHESFCRHPHSRTTTTTGAAAAAPAHATVGAAATVRAGTAFPLRIRSRLARLTRLAPRPAAASPTGRRLLFRRGGHFKRPRKRRVVARRVAAAVVGG